VGHVTETDVQLFVSGRMAGSALRAVVRHILGCAACRSRVGCFAPVLDDEEPVPSEAPEPALDVYDAAVDRALAGVGRHVAFWAEEKTHSERLLERARERPDLEDSGRFAGLSARTHGWAWVETQLALSFELRYRDPHRMLMTTFALTGALEDLGSKKIDRGRYTPGILSALKTHVWIEFANAARLNHHYDDAEEALSNAAKLLNEETLDPFLAGRHLDIEASLRMDQRRLGEALDLLNKLHRHYLELGETHLAGRTLISKGIALYYDDRPHEAVSALREGLKRIDRQRDPMLRARASHDLLTALVEIGEFLEASEILLESGLRQAFIDDPLNLLKLRGVEGKIFAGLGKLHRAEEILAQVREGFLLQGREYDSVAVGLELAGVLLRQGRSAEVENLAEEALETLKDLPVSPEALRAVRYLRAACRQREASAGLVQEVVSFLNRLEHHPDLRFRA
jgi:tetratricopeptide (TPR) repeat protein